MGYRTWSDITAPAPKDAVVLEITGKQFNWIARYPGKDGKLGTYNYKLIDATNEVGIDFSDKSSFDDFLPREIHVPKGKPVQFKIRARDVLHSVFLPHFRQKMDAVPGMPTTFWFTPIYTTEEMKSITGNPNFKYELACTEVCGRGHFGMKFLLVVDEPEDFEKWYASQEAFLKKNPDYLANVPSDLKKIALK
jgi:cytochrome c oxidase subunit 2